MKTRKVAPVPAPSTRQDRALLITDRRLKKRPPEMVDLLTAWERLPYIQKMMTVVAMINHMAGGSDCRGR